MAPAFSAALVWQVVCWCCSKSPSRRARHHWSKDAVWALSKPSEDAYRRQASFLDARRLNSAGFEAKAPRRFQSRCRIAAAEDAYTCSLTGFATAAAATAQTKRQSASYHTSSATQPPQKPRAQARHRVILQGRRAEKSAIAASHRARHRSRAYRRRRRSRHPQSHRIRAQTR